jgi:hypothetical protein
MAGRSQGQVFIYPRPDLGPVAGGEREHGPEDNLARDLKAGVAVSKSEIITGLPAFGTVVCPELRLLKKISQAMSEGARVPPDRPADGSRDPGQEF